MENKELLTLCAQEAAVKANELEVNNYTLIVNELAAIVNETLILKADSSNNSEYLK